VRREVIFNSVKDRKLDMFALHEAQNSPSTTTWLDMIERLRLVLAQSRQEPVEMIQTHISVVLLGRSVALKLKKPVDFGFLDYTTLEKRRAACDAEVTLNRRLCPNAYLGVVPVMERNGVLRCHGDGIVIDYAVLMKRLPAERMLDLLVENGEVTETIIKRVAARLADFHNEARRGPEVDEFGSAAAIRNNWDENFTQVAPYIGRTISEQNFESIHCWVYDWLDKHEELFRSRVLDGRICDGHGDVRCESVCVTDETLEGICIFDCIEFNDRFRCGDVAGEAAFLATDLDARGRPDLGYLFTEEYSARAADEQLFSLLPFYKCYRAFVRGKVLSFRLDEPEFNEAEQQDAANRARHFFDLAARYAAPLSTPAVIAVSGLSGTGKTALARALAGELGLRVVSSDAVRATIFGDEKRPSEYGQDCYSEKANRMIYKTLLERGQEYLKAQGGVILDATFLRVSDRAAAQEMARQSGAAWRLIVCKAPPESVRARLAHRAAQRDGQSDADWNIYLQQQQKFEPLSGECDGCRLLLDTSDALPTVSQTAAHWLRAGELRDA
jgi:aminoglycoside phosphotransferase family enzyme/predicted kinase